LNDERGRLGTIFGVFRSHVGSFLPSKKLLVLGLHLGTQKRNVKPPYVYLSRIGHTASRQRRPFRPRGFQFRFSRARLDATVYRKSRVMAKSFSAVKPSTGRSSFYSKVKKKIVCAIFRIIEFVSRDSHHVDTSLPAHLNRIRTGITLILGYCTVSTMAHHFTLLAPKKRG
jgi:hypothetical protein